MMSKHPKETAVSINHQSINVNKIRMRNSQVELKATSIPVFQYHYSEHKEEGIYFLLEMIP